MDVTPKKQIAIIINGDTDPQSAAKHAENVKRAAGELDGYEIFAASTSDDAPDGVAKDHYYKADPKNIMAMLAEVKARAGSDTDIVVYITGHGMPEGVCIGENCDTASIFQLIDELAYKNRTIIMDQCYSGNQAARFTDDPRSLFIAGGNKNQTTCCGEFAPNFFADKNKIKDLNNDGQISFQERFSHTIAANGKEMSSEPQMIFTKGYDDLGSPPFKAGVVEVTTESELKAQLKKLKPGQKAVVMFSMPGCGPCKAFAPVYRKMAEEMGGNYLFIYSNSDELANALGIYSFPTISIYDDLGVHVEVAADKNELKEVLAQPSGNDINARMKSLRDAFGGKDGAYVFNIYMKNLADLKGAPLAAEIKSLFNDLKTADPKAIEYNLKACKYILEKFDFNIPKQALNFVDGLIWQITNGKLTPHDTKLVEELTLKYFRKLGDEEKQEIIDKHIGRLSGNSSVQEKFVELRFLQHCASVMTQSQLELAADAARSVMFADDKNLTRANKNAAEKIYKEIVCHMNGTSAEAEALRLIARLNGNETNDGAVFIALLCLPAGNDPVKIIAAFSKVMSKGELSPAKAFATEEFIQKLLQKVTVQQKRELLDQHIGKLADNNGVQDKFFALNILRHCTNLMTQPQLELAASAARSIIFTNDKEVPKRYKESAVGTYTALACHMKGDAANSEAAILTHYLGGNAESKELAAEALLGLLTDSNSANKTALSKDTLLKIAKALTLKSASASERRLNDVLFERLSPVISAEEVNALSKTLREQLYSRDASVRRAALQNFAKIGHKLGSEEAAAAAAQIRLLALTNKDSNDYIVQDAYEAVCKSLSQNVSIFERQMLMAAMAESKSIDELAYCTELYVCHSEKIPPNEALQVSRMLAGKIQKLEYSNSSLDSKYEICSYYKKIAARLDTDGADKAGASFLAATKHQAFLNKDIIAEMFGATVQKMSNNMFRLCLDDVTAHLNGKKLPKDVNTAMQTAYIGMIPRIPFEEARKHIVLKIDAKNNELFGGDRKISDAIRKHWHGVFLKKAQFLNKTADDEAVKGAGANLELVKSAREQALENFIKSIRLHEKDLGAWLETAELLLKMKMHEKASDLLQKATLVDGFESDANMAKINTLLAKISFDEGNLSYAEGYVKDALANLRNAPRRDEKAIEGLLQLQDKIAKKKAFAPRHAK